MLFILERHLNEFAVIFDLVLFEYIGKSGQLDHRDCVEPDSADEVVVEALGVAYLHSLFILFVAGKGVFDLDHEVEVVLDPLSVEGLLHHLPVGEEIPDGAVLVDRGFFDGVVLEVDDFKEGEVLLAEAVDVDPELAEDPLLDVAEALEGLHIDDYAPTDREGHDNRDLLPVHQGLQVVLDREVAHLLRVLDLPQHPLHQVTEGLRLDLVETAAVQPLDENVEPGQHEILVRTVCVEEDREHLVHASLAKIVVRVELSKNLQKGLVDKFLGDGFEEGEELVDESEGLVEVVLLAYFEEEVEYFYGLLIVFRGHESHGAADGVVLVDQHFLVGFDVTEEGRPLPEDFFHELAHRKHDDLIEVFGRNIIDGESAVLAG